MKNKKKKSKMSLVERMKKVVSSIHRFIEELVAWDMETDGKVSAAILVIMCFLAIILIAIICFFIKA